MALTLFTIVLVLIFRYHLLVYTAVLFVCGNVVLFVWSLVSTRGLTVERKHSATSLRGYPLQIELVVVNRFGLPRFALVGFDEFAPGRESQKFHEVALLSVGAKSSASANYEAIPIRRGKFEVGPFYFYSGDPFGFYRYLRRVNVLTPLIVLPTPLDTRVNYLRSSSVLPKDELATLPMAGSSPEFLGVREYQPGDPVRKVHWASTARLGTLITKQFERNVASTMSVLLVNNERSTEGGNEEHNPLEYAITLVSTLARETGRSHYYFSFMEINGRAVRHLSGMGGGFFQQLSLMLAEIVPGERLDLSDWPKQILQHLPTGSDLIVFIPELTGAEAQFLANLRLNYRLLSVVTFDLESFRRGAPRHTPRSRVSFGRNFLIFEIAFGDDLSRQLEAFVEKVGFIR